MVLENAIHDPARLLVLIARGHERRPLTCRAPRPQVLGVPFRRAGDERVGDVEDGLRGAVVLLERHDRGAGELGRKVEDVANRGAAERVDALRVVADDGDVPVSAGHPLEDARLEEVRVLILVHEHVIVEPGDAAAELLVGEHAGPEEEQVVVVHEIALGLPLRVVGEHADDLLPLVEELRELVAQDGLDRELGVHVPGVDVMQRLLLRKARLLLAEAERGAGDAHEILGVALIEDREVPGDPRRLAVGAQQTMRGAVERPAVHARAGAADEALGAREHLLRRPPGEGEEEDAIRADPAGDEVRDAIDERARLPGAGPGDDQERAVTEGGGGALLGVEVGGEVRRGRHLPEYTTIAAGRASFWRTRQRGIGHPTSGLARRDMRDEPRMPHAGCWMPMSSTSSLWSRETGSRSKTLANASAAAASASSMAGLRAVSRAMEVIVTP